MILGASGGIGAAMAQALSRKGDFARVLSYSRAGSPPLDLTREASIAETAADAAARSADIRLVFDATGVLQGQGATPEKTWRSVTAESLGQAFAINAIGPALIMKHFLPLLPRRGKAVFATLSARVGSIGDNRLGGWYGYRASKAALNQLMRTASVELARQRPDAICIALHPGTVATPLSAPHATTGLDVQSPEVCAERLIAVLDSLAPADTGGFLDHLGRPVPW